MSQVNQDKPTRGERKVQKSYRAKMAVEFPQGKILPEGSIVQSTEELPGHCFELVVPEEV